MTDDPEAAGFGVNALARFTHPVAVTLTDVLRHIAPGKALGKSMFALQCLVLLSFQALAETTNPVLDRGDGLTVGSFPAFIPMRSQFLQIATELLDGLLHGLPARWLQALLYRAALGGLLHGRNRRRRI